MEAKGHRAAEEDKERKMEQIVTENKHLKLKIDKMAKDAGKHDAQAELYQKKKDEDFLKEIQYLQVFFIFSNLCFCKIKKK